MNKIYMFLVAFALLFSVQKVQACSICGCGTGGYYLGVTPQIQKNIIGVRYRHLSFNSYENMGDFRSSSSEQFASAELWGRYYIRTRWQVTAFLPFQMNKRVDDGVTKHLNGLGDAMAMVQYNLFNSFLRVDTVGRLFQHNWFVGGGLKAPFGKYNHTDTNNEKINPNFQLGTGSWDFLLTTSYTLRYKQVGFTTDISYKSNSENSNTYRFGDKTAINASFFGLINQKMWTFMPSVGTSFEHSFANYNKHYKVDNTGGTVTFANLSTDIFYKEWTIGALWQLPVHKRLGEGNITPQNRLMLQLAYIF